MDTRRLGVAIRTVRQRRDWTQRELGRRAGVSRQTVARVELGDTDAMRLELVERVARAAEVGIRVVPQWRGGDLDRLINRRHSLLHDAVARRFRAAWPEWTLAPEVSFAIFGERGVIDALAWHPRRLELLVIELKTEIVDVNELIGGVDRKRRLGPGIARGRGWVARSVSCWVIVADSRTNRRRAAAHAGLLRSAFPDDGRAVMPWLGRGGDAGAGDGVSALSFWPNAPGAGLGRGLSGRRRVVKGRARSRHA